MSKSKASHLKELRETLGLSKKSLAESLGVGRDTIRHWEDGRYTPQKRFEKKLKEIFGEEYVSGEKPAKLTKDFYDKEYLAAQAAAQSLSRIARTFTEGHYYNISDTPNPSDNSVLQQVKLRYEGKEGIHHVFRAERGKWVVTYTDAQLVGKHVKEVQTE